MKREDLCADAPAPPLGKLRGMVRVVDKLVAGGAEKIGCWDTRVSKMGIGLAVACASRGVQAIVCYPHLKNGATPDTIRRAAALGAEIVKMRGNHVSICYSQATRIVRKKGGEMIPLDWNAKNQLKK